MSDVVKHPDAEARHAMLADLLAAGDAKAETQATQRADS